MAFDSKIRFLALAIADEVFREHKGLRPRGWPALVAAEMVKRCEGGRAPTVDSIRGWVRDRDRERSRAGVGEKPTGLRVVEGKLKRAVKRVAAHGDEPPSRARSTDENGKRNSTSERGIPEYRDDVTRNEVVAMCLYGMSVGAEELVMDLVNGYTEREGCSPVALSPQTKAKILDSLSNVVKANTDIAASVDALVITVVNQAGEPANLTIDNGELPPLPDAGGEDDT